MCVGRGGEGEGGGGAWASGGAPQKLRYLLKIDERTLNIPRTTTTTTHIPNKLYDSSTLVPAPRLIHSQ